MEARCRRGIYNAARALKYLRIELQIPLRLTAFDTSPSQGRISAVHTKDPQFLFSSLQKYVTNINSTMKFIRD